MEYPNLLAILEKAFTPAAARLLLDELIEDGKQDPTSLCLYDDTQLSDCFFWDESSRGYAFWAHVDLIIDQVGGTAK